MALGLSLFAWIDSNVPQLESLHALGGGMSDTKNVECQLHPFAYRHKADGSIDSICLACYLTAATAENEAELHDREKSHDCPGRRSERPPEFDHRRK
jgi:hypothetical protein